ncbi:hypothetical protein BDZ94DRAFT_186377 [Collybia nuda]|uniref:Uncharacterized protein n=1 Tax=Collybia nuda TaxID=64659 RepID=A0A9P6CNG1_9AGAR|nr:hypothetical protein BDZ94DRAFT_186377 [Collybia nuda]
MPASTVWCQVWHTEDGRSILSIVFFPLFFCFLSLLMRESHVLLITMKCNNSFLFPIIIYPLFYNFCHDVQASHPFFSYLTLRTMYQFNAFTYPRLMINAINCCW